MKIILLERVPNLGIIGDVVTVKDGYGRNYLLPMKKAQRATKANIELFESKRHQLEAQNITRRDEAKAVAERMKDALVTVIRSASEAGHLFGSVRSTDISEGLKVSGYTVSKNQVQLNTPIKTLGLHTAMVILHPEVTIDVSVIVSRTAEEAQVQLEALKKAAQKESLKSASEAIIEEISGSTKEELSA